LNSWTEHDWVSRNPRARPRSRWQRAKRWYRGG
jgi:hypothetical protein